MSIKNQPVGYLPDERPPIVELIFFALQQIVVMFPATVLVALITGFHVSTTIFASGLSTLCFILITGRKFLSTMVPAFPTSQQLLLLWERNNFLV